MSSRMRNIQHAPGAHMKVDASGGRLVLTLGGRLDAVSTAAIWDEAMNVVRSRAARSVVLDCSKLHYLDGAGVALILKIREAVEDVQGGTLHVENLGDEQQQILKMVWNCTPPRWDAKAPERRRGLAIVLGHFTAQAWEAFSRMVAFVGESVFIIFRCLWRPGCVRWKDVWLSTVSVGVNSLSIILLIGFLMGLIMSFQTAISLQRFGAEIFVPNMLGLVMFREMGPLVTAILLAARSGSAFAAEIGTMKVNEEVDALVTMGLSPMRFLVAPKVLASLFAVPLMTMFFNFASLVGGAVVMLSMDYPLVTFTSRVFRLLGYVDFAGGLFKACVFSLLVAGVGCLRGLETGTGASAVGVSTTSAVVSGIIAIAIADGVFALAFYYLGI